MFETHFYEKKIVLNRLVYRFQMLNAFYCSFSYQATMLTSIEVSRGSPSAPELFSFFLQPSWYNRNLSQDTICPGFWEGYKYFGFLVPPSRKSPVSIAYL